VLADWALAFGLSRVVGSAQLRGSTRLAKGAKEFVRVGEAGLWRVALWEANHHNEPYKRDLLVAPDPNTPSSGTRHAPRTAGRRHLPLPRALARLQRRRIELVKL